MLSNYPFYEIAPGIFEINEFDGPSMFLICGSERTLLIDTGIGIGDITCFIKNFTNNPVDVLLTHNHRDHVGNAPLFDEVYLSSIDTIIGPIIRPWTSRESRLQFAHNVCKGERCGDEYNWTDEDVYSFDQSQEPLVHKIEDGFIFKLGDRNVSCWLCPGHTPGSIVAIDSKTGTLFCGDSCNNLVGIGIRPIPGLHQTSIETSLHALRRIWKMEFSHERIFNAHPDFRGVGQPLSPNVWITLMTGMERILDDDYVIRKEWIQNINTIAETAVFGNVEIQFHTDNIFDAQNVQEG